jgi:signal transduction histidine kinase
MKRGASVQATITPAILPIFTVALTVAIFIFDTVTDLEIAGAVLYVAVVLMSLRFCRRRAVMLVSAGCMALTLLSYFLTPTGSPQSGLVNTIISLTAIGATTYLALKIQSAEVATLEARAQLAHVARLTALGELTASIAHEINQPLAAVITSGNACLRWLDGQTPNFEKAKQSVKRIVNDANRASEVVGRVRNLAKRTPPKKEPLNLNETILAIVDLARGEIEQNYISLSTRLADDLPIVLGGRVQLQQVLLNLILNAIEAVNAANEGTREVMISSSRDQSGGVQIAIHDSGIGLECSEIDHLFDAFHTTKPGGMGIGLTFGAASGIEPLRLSATHVEGTATWSVENIALPAIGRWQVRVEILVTDFEKVSIEDEFDLLR